MRVIVYLRVSTDRQSEEGCSLEAQESSATTYCLHHGHEIVRVERDEASGKSADGRPGLGRVFAALHKGEADGVVIWKLDRLTRSLRDLTEWLSTYFHGDSKRTGYALLSVKDELNTSTPNGKFFVHMLGAIAEFERENIRLRTREAISHLKATGKVYGFVPIGYKRVDVRDANGKVIDANLVPDEEGQVTVAMIRDLTAKGLGLYEIACELSAAKRPTSKGGANWHPSAVAVVQKRLGIWTKGRKGRKPLFRRAA